MTHNAQIAPTSRKSTNLVTPFMVRPAQGDDVWMLADLFYHLSAQTRYLRYFLPLPLSLANAWAEGRRMARRPAACGQTLIATVQPAGIAEAVGVAELVYDPQTPTQGELAVLVRDDQQGRGIGTALVCELLTKAQAQGIDELHADLLPENRAALRLLRRLQLPMDTSINAGGIHVTMRPLQYRPDKGVGLAAGENERR